MARSYFCITQHVTNMVIFFVVLDFEKKILIRYKQQTCTVQAQIKLAEFFLNNICGRSVCVFLV